MKGLELAEKRKVCKIGDSSFVSLPQTWLNLHNLKVGDKLVLVINSNKTLIIKPEQKENGTKMD